MKRFVQIIALALALSLILASAALADGFRTLDEIKESGNIVIGLFHDKKPFGFVDEYGEYQGYDVYLARRLAKDLDVELELALHPGVAVAPLVSLLQARLKERILEMTGIRVGKVSILVEAAAEGDKPKEPPIQLLPGGDS